MTSVSQSPLIGNAVARIQEPVHVFKDGRWQVAPRHQIENYLVQVLLVTPEWAAKVLAERNRLNRDQKLAYQEKLIHALQSGRFFLTNQGIGFYTDGQLADGQNRLAAIVKSGKAARMIVVFGIDPAAKAAIDDGIKRSDIDIARLEGDRNTPSRAIMIGNTIIAMMQGINSPDKYEKQDFYSAYMEGLMFTHNSFLPVKVKGVTQMSVLAAVCRAYYTVKDTPDQLQRLKDFVRVLHQGLGDPNKDRAAIKLRNLLIEEMPSGKIKSNLSSGYQRAEIYRKTEKAIWHFLRSEPIDKLYEAKGEIYPLPGEHEFFAKVDGDATIAGTIGVNEQQ